MLCFKTAFSRKYIYNISYENHYGGGSSLSFSDSSMLIKYFILARPSLAAV